MPGVGFVQTEKVRLYRNFSGKLYSHALEFIEQI